MMIQISLQNMSQYIWLYFIFDIIITYIIYIYNMKIDENPFPRKLYLNTKLKQTLLKKCSSTLMFRDV